MSILLILTVLIFDDAGVFCQISRITHCRPVTGINIQRIPIFRSFARQAVTSLLFQKCTPAYPRSKLVELCNYYFVDSISAILTFLTGRRMPDFRLISAPRSFFSLLKLIHNFRFSSLKKFEKSANFCPFYAAER